MPSSANTLSLSFASKPLIDVSHEASLKSASPARTSSSHGTKRKRATDPKFYAVRVGNHPGIYHSWKECLEQVKGFRNATCELSISQAMPTQADQALLVKSFPTLTDAERFLAGEEPLRSSDGTAPSSPEKFYAVRSGKVPGIYTDWPSAQKQIIGWQKTKQKCFPTRAEALRFMEEGDSDRLEKYEADVTDYEHITPDLGRENSETSLRGLISKKSKKNFNVSNSSSKNIKIGILEYNEEDYEPGTGPLPPGIEDGFDPQILLDGKTGNVVYKTQAQRRATRLQAIGPSSDGMLRIHTDGSSIGNGTKGAIAGVGVYFGPNDRRNISEALPGPRQTNQRAELTAVLRALDTVPRDRDVTIVTDSQYAKDCVTVWYVNWRKNGWKTSAGKPVENKDLVESVLYKIEERNALGSQTSFEWIKGHDNHPGNEAADRLAVNGARNATLQ